MPDAYEQQEFFATQQPESRSREGPDSVGGELRAAREAVGRDIDEVSATLKIRASHLDAIEQGRFGDLPGQTYAIGFVRTYASYLGFDAEDVVRRFKAEIVGLEDRTELMFRAPERNARLPFVLIAIISLLVAVAIYALWFYVVREPEPEPLAAGDAAAAAVGTQPDAPASAAPDDAAEDHDAVAAPSQPAKEETDGWTVVPSEGASPLAEQQGAAPQAAAAQAPAVRENGADAAAAAGEESTDATAAPAEGAEPMALVPDGGANIVIHATNDSWIQIRAGDGEVLLSRVLSAGESYAVPDRAGLTMVTGNAGAIRVSVNGRTTPPLGEAGGVRRDIELTAEALMAGPSR